MTYDLSIINCPGYTLDLETQTVSDKEGNTVTDNEGLAAVIINGERHNVNIAKLAWCALHKVCPLDVSNDYVFYLRGNVNPVPVKMNVAILTTTSNKKQMDYKSSLKSWAESQGFYSTEKYVRAMHNFLKKNKISLKEADDYTVIKLSDRQPELLAENKDQKNISLPAELYENIERFAAESKLPTSKCIQKMLEILTLPMPLEFFEFLNDVICHDKPLSLLEDVYNKAIQNESDLFLMREEIKSLRDEKNKLLAKLDENDLGQEAVNKNHILPKTLLPVNWWLQHIDMVYKNKTDEKILTIVLNNQNNKVVIQSVDPRENNNIKINDFIAILNDAKYRLLTANNADNNSQDEIEQKENNGLG